MGVFLSNLGIDARLRALYNFVKIQSLLRRAHKMKNELKSLIIELLDAVTDLDLLDLVYKILLSSLPTKSGRC